MNAYRAQIRMNLRLTMRDRTVLFFNYLFPLIFFFLFAQMMRAQQGGITQVVDMVLTIGVLGNGLMGAGLRAVSDREQNILRRFKVAPINAGPILVASLVTGLVHFLPLVAVVLVMAHWLYGMPLPEHRMALLAFIAVGVLAFRSLGGMIAAVVNSMQESQILVQILYITMLLVGGATIPLAVMPSWLQTAAQFLPATHFSTGIQSMLLRNETLLDNLPALGALALTTLLATFLGVKLFRWEKEEKMRASAKLWLVAVLAPFLLIGAWQMHAKTNLVREKILARDLSRGRTLLIRDARLFIGDGTVIGRGSVLIKKGKIAQVFTGQAPDPKALKAEAVDGAGKTLLPGLVDVHVHLDASGGFSQNKSGDQNIDPMIDRELAAYLYSGVTTVKDVGGALDSGLKHRAAIASGEKLGAELFIVGPMFTAEGGHGTEFLKYVPEAYRSMVAQQVVRIPKTPEEARAQVMELKQRGVDGIKAILEAGAGSMHYNRLDLRILKALADAAHEAGLPIVCHTGAAQDVADALDAGVDGIEHGSLRDLIPAELFERMKQKGVYYDPTLAVMEAIQDFGKGDASPLDRSLVEQTAPPQVLMDTRKLIDSPQLAAIRASYAGYPVRLDLAEQNLATAYRAGVTLVTGTDSGNPLLLHGPALHRELQLWIQAGIPPAAALQAATENGARLLHQDRHLGLIREGYDANLLLVDGNPLQDITATERISAVMFLGERVQRQGLLSGEYVENGR